MRFKSFLVVIFIACMASSPASAGDQGLTHALAMNGQPKYPAGFDHFEYVNPDAPKGGTVRLAAVGSFDSLNPFITKGVSAAGISLVYDTLTVHSLDEPFTQYGLLAEKVELAPDRSWVIYHLNPKAKWHDGRPVLAEDVVFSFYTLFEKGDVHYRQYYADVEKVEALDERRVKFHLGDKTNPELALIVGQLTVLPKHFWEGKDFEKTSLEIPLGSGPYQVAEFKPGQSITYELVEDYWGRDLPVNRGINNFQTLIYDYYRDTTVALQAFLAGEFDFRQENISKEWATAYTGPAFDQGLIKKEEIPHDDNQGMQGFVFNTRREIFKDRKVRLALTYAFDFEWTNKNLFYGQYKRSESYFSNSELACSGLPSPEELKYLEPLKDKLYPEVFTEEYKAPSTDGSGNNRANLRQALKLLKEAGWVIKDKKMVDQKTGRPLEFEILLVSPSLERIVAPFKDNLSRLGVNVTYRVVDTSQYINRLNTFDFDMIVMTFPQSLSPGNEQRYFWHSSSADMPGSRNYMGIKDPAVDALVDLVISAPDRKELVYRTRALDRALLWGYWVIPQWHLDYYRVAYWDKFSRPEVSPKYSLGFMTWWVDQERESRLGKRKK